jgi:excisionase family DNA binding protein
VEVEEGASRRSPQPPGHSGPAAAIHLAHNPEAIIVNTPNRESGPDRRQLIDIPTLAQWLGTSIRHVRRLVAERRVPYFKVGHLIRFDPEEIWQWLSEHAHEVSA